MREYLAVLRYPNAKAMLFTSFPARLAYGMIGLGLYFKTYQATGSIAFAGLVAGTSGISGSITTGLRAAALDRFGIKRPLRILVTTYALAILLVNYVDSRSTLLIAGIALGAGAPPINLSLRPMWRLAIPKPKMRIALALDTSFLNLASILGPVLVTFLALSKHPSLSLISCSALILTGGLSMSFLKISNEWKPEQKAPGDKRIFQVPGIRLLLVEGICIGLGMGIFTIAIPAFTTLTHTEHLTGTIFAVGAATAIIGGLAAGSFGKHLSPLNAFKKNYILWFIASIPLAFTTPGWSLLLIVGLLGFANGAQQVFYLEIVEAVRPHGTAASAIGWMWMIEGTAAAVGESIGGSVSQRYSPQICFAFTTVMVFCGMVIVFWGKRWLKDADQLHINRDQ